MIEEFDNAAYARILCQYMPRPIHTEENNRRAIAALESLDASETLSPEQSALAELFTTLIETFEEAHYSINICVTCESSDVRPVASDRTVNVGACSITIPSSVHMKCSNCGESYQTGEQAKALDAAIVDAKMRHKARFNPPRPNRAAVPSEPQ
jgi:YgiT-type zinc finger domain-containing protein